MNVYVSKNYTVLKIQEEILANKNLFKNFRIYISGDK